MRDRTHWFGCWKTHHECALARIEQLEKALEKIKYIASGKEGTPSVYDFNRVLTIIDSMKERKVA